MYFITGCAGFIGFHLSVFLLKQGKKVTGIDNLNNYYDVKLKLDRLEILKKYKNFEFIKIALEDKSIKEIIQKRDPKFIIHLAAQAGVRFSLENPETYIKSNIDGFLNILESCKNISIKHLIYASSSSVYGANTKLPFSEKDNVDHPVSLYAATKKSNELMAHVYSHLFNIPTTGLRFFTVYGPWGRPDMALFKFTDSILKGEKIDVYNYGKMKRDFTYIDDIINGINKVIYNIPEKTTTPYRIYNIGNNKPVDLLYFIKCIEQECNKNAEINLMPIQPGDVEATYADIDNISELGFYPETSIEKGIKNFIEWYRCYYK
ncbi:MAG: NAD-dependent epimerase/dehydratase family protein [Candidatus Muiribacteriota bacterium]